MCEYRRGKRQEADWRGGRQFRRCNSGADDELLNTKDLNFFGDASVIECAALLLLTLVANILQHPASCQAHKDVSNKVVLKFFLATP